MKKNILTILLLFSAIVFASAQTQPNIIVILSDDQGYGDFSCYGNPIVKTPNMDRLYDEGVRFTSFYTMPVCAPTRAGLLTGRSNYRTGIWDTWKWGNNIRPDEYMLPEALRDVGYKTALFGKWHLGYNYPMRPGDQGFEETYEWEFFAKAQDNRLNPVMRRNSGKPAVEEGFLTDLVFDEAVKYVQQNSKKEEPFFMYVASFLPHTWEGVQVPRKYVEPFMGIDTLSQHTKEVYGMVANLDENLGRLLNTIDEAGIAENTIVIYTSDNGPDTKGGRYLKERYNLGLRGSKGTVYEGGIKLPYFVRWPEKLNGGRDIHEPVSHIDIMPTLLEITGAQNSHKPMDGLSLAPLLFEKQESLPQRILCGQFYRSYLPIHWKNSFIREGDFKLVEGCELYNLKEDPLEQHNLSEKNPRMVEQLRAKYQQWFASVLSERGNTKGFQTSPTYIGHPNQTEIDLKYSNKRPVEGWPLDISEEGPYEITIQQIQHELFEGKTKMVLQVGGNSWIKTIDPNNLSLTFEDVRLPLGEHFLTIYFLGEMEQKPFRGGFDIGHRNISINKK